MKTRCLYKSTAKQSTTPYFSLKGVFYSLCWFVFDIFLVFS